MLKQTNLVVILACILSLVLVEYSGRQSRTYVSQPVIISVASTEEIYRSWKKLGIKGRIGLYFSRYLNFIDINSHELVGENKGFPIENAPREQRYEQLLSDGNVLWVSAIANILRRVCHVVPRSTFSARITGSKSDPLFVLEDGMISSKHEIIPRAITTLPDIPQFKEPVVIAFHPSYFEFGESPEEVFALIQNGRIKPDVVIFCIPGHYGQKEAIAKLLRLRSMIEHSL